MLKGLGMACVLVGAVALGLSSSHRSLPAPVVCSMTTVENGFSTTRSTVHGMAFSVPSVVK